MSRNYGPKAHMSRQKQAQPEGLASEGQVWPYLVFKELGSFLPAHCPHTRARPPTVAESERQLWSGIEVSQWDNRNTVVQILVSRVKMWVQIPFIC